MRSFEQSSSQSEPSPFGDLDAYNEFVKQQQEQEDARKQADAEKGIVDRQVLQQGERSTVSMLKMENGEEHYEIDSEYQDNATEFKQQHPNIKEDFYLNLSIGCLAVDLASLDATHYDCYTQGDEKTKDAFLKNYRLLRQRLDDESTPTEERQLISSYLQLQNGEQLSFLQNQYDEAQVAQSTGERFKNELAQMREEIEEKRKDLDEKDEDLKTILDQIEFLRNDRSIDYQELNQAVSNLLGAIEDASDTAKDFKTANNAFIDAISKNQSQFSQETVDDSKSYHKNNDEAIQQKIKQLDSLNEQFQRYKRQLDEILYRYS